MKKLLIVAALSCASAFAITVADGKVSFTADERQVLTRCESEGGCFVVTVAMVENYARAHVHQYMQMVQEAFEGAVKQEAKALCGKTV